VLKVCVSVSRATNPPRISRTYDPEVPFESAHAEESELLLPPFQYFQMPRLQTADKDDFGKARRSVKSSIVRSETKRRPRNGKRRSKWN
jgi:hypothetical protein